MRIQAAMHLDSEPEADPRLFVMFHGYGNDESEMIRILDAIYEHADHAPNYLSFRGTHPRPYIGGNYWYPDGCSVSVRRQACHDVGNAVVAMLDSPLLRSYRPVLMGFSQGGYLSYRLVCEHPHFADAALLLSPSFKGEEDAVVHTSTRFALAYGDDDRTIPAVDQRNARRVLEATGHLTHWQYAHTGHTICDQEIDDLREFLEL